MIICMLHGPHSQPPPKTPPPSPGQLPDPRYHLAPQLVPSPLSLGMGHIWCYSSFKPIQIPTDTLRPIFFQQIPIANGGFNGKIYGKIINLQGQWGVPARPPARIAPSTSLHWLRRRAWSEPTTIPRPLAGDPCHRRCPFTCPRKSCRLGKMRCQYQTNHLRSNTFEKYPWIKWV